MVILEGLVSELLKVKKAGVSIVKVFMSESGYLSFLSQHLVAQFHYLLISRPVSVFILESLEHDRELV